MKSKLSKLIREQLEKSISERVFINPSPSSGRDISLDDTGKPKFGTVAGAAKQAISALTKSYPELKNDAQTVASILLAVKSRKNDIVTIKGMDYEIKPHILKALLNFDKAVAAQEDAYENPESRKTLQALADKSTDGVDLSSYISFLDNDRDFTPSLGKRQTQRFVSKELGLDEEELNEMAKIQGDLKSAIGNVVAANPDLDKLALKKKIKADKSVIDALGDQTLYDNQLNKFIALLQGEREIGKRGRKKGSTKKTEPKTKSTTKSTPKPEEKSKPEPKSKSLSKDEKEQKFNTGLKFIKKYKDDKSKVDSYLKKAKEEYKLPKFMIDDLKRTAGREV